MLQLYLSLLKQNLCVLFASAMEASYLLLQEIHQNQIELKNLLINLNREVALLCENGSWEIAEEETPCYEECFSEEETEDIND